ncbi:hypothetical protein PC128_g24264 [Phytophthora cactorum]|nr:hypothetical protein PC128_g24264 [Phytophthora cactorum]
MAVIKEKSKNYVVMLDDIRHHRQRAPEHDCWPYDEIKVNIVGFAAKKASELGWSDNSMGKIYFCDLDKDGSPQCPRTAIDRRMDRPEDDPSPAGGGWGIYWGQQVNLDDMLEHLDDGELEIVSHEMGDGFGLPDFY